jgi:hypothetical protein
VTGRKLISMGLGGFPLQHLSLESVALDRIVFVPSMSEFQRMSKKEISDKFREFDSLDAVVWRLSGEDPNLFIWRLRLLGLLSEFQNRNFKAVFWTMDTHHMLSREARAAKYFDHVFIAHSPYVHNFPTEKTSFLPCSVSIESKSNIQGVIDRLQNKPAKNSCVALFANYPGQQRNLEYSKILELLGDLPVEHFFGQARGGSTPNSELISKTLEHKIVINLSLADDLNMRNFEALALNRVLLTNFVPDFHILGDWEQNIVVFERDLRDFQEKLEIALSKSPDDVSSSFLEKHHITNRLIQIVSTLFPDAALKANSGNMKVENNQNENLLPPSIHEYEYLELLSSAGSYALKFNTTLKAFREFGAFQALLFFLRALRAAFFRLILNTIGKLSWLRALITAVSSKPANTH